MTERYIDPNSGAAPQPGGYAARTQVTQQAAKAAEQETSEEPKAPEEPTSEVPETPEEPAQPEVPEEQQSEEGFSDSEGSGEGQAEESKDYSELLSQNAASVVAYMDEHPDEKEAIQAAESEGKNRSSIINR